MLANRRGIILGKDRLAALNKRVGERFTVYSQMYRGIDLEFEIVGVFPPGRWDAFAVMNADYLNEAIDAYGRTPGNSAHPLADKRLNLVWLRLPDEDAFNRVSAQIAASPYYTNPAVKCETLASLVTASMTALRDIIWAFRWLLGPGGPGQPLAADRQRHQHQRPRAPRGTGRAQGAGLSLPPDSPAGAGRGPA